ncbi:alpha/beta hydrolase family protein [Cellulomonas edaphi]|uniref:Alpha/beta hydrolase n=1 Tax=Cellulomonas edaphi TaxID=3053468 RepID=A0ABT7S8C3_9CELL|nr:alpha/beta hydrolase [Cellulomons edaphi]MDM7831863.1 alpha/beta hydrolase [Cellulomons edaphi]
MQPDVVVPYGPHADQVVDLHLPDRRDAPLVCLLHGGFWRAAYDRMHVRVVVDALTAAGYAVANVEYRRVGSGGGWPGTFDDVAAALDAVPAMLAERLPGRANTGSIVYVGHSAGGHLALWAALRSPAPRVLGVVPLAPVADLGAAHALGLSRGAVSELLGGSPTDVPDRYSAADPMALGRPHARAVVLHGERDDVAPLALSQAYAARTGVELRALPGIGHFELIDPTSSAWPAVRTAIDDVAQSGREPSGMGPTVAP